MAAMKKINWNYETYFQTPVSHIERISEDEDGQAGFVKVNTFRGKSAICRSVKSPTGEWTVRYDSNLYIISDEEYQNFNTTGNYDRESYARKVEAVRKIAEAMTGTTRAKATVTIGEETIEITETEEPAAEQPAGPVKHSKHDLIKTCISNDLPVYLVGEAGTGKNFTLQAIAEELGMSFYFTNSVQQEYKITGFIDAGGKYHETEFYKAFLNGGVFFLDEIDASIPEVLVLLNAAIANRYFEFPNGKITAHKDFRVVAAGNTVGSGASELYTGRLVLDSATLDRFVVIEFDYDQNIEMALAKGNEQLVTFIRGLRTFCKSNGIRATFSYRMIMSVTALENAGVALNDILKIAVLKGMNQDTVRTIRPNILEANKYASALLAMRVA